MPKDFRQALDGVEYPGHSPVTAADEDAEAFEDGEGLEYGLWSAESEWISHVVAFV